LARAPSPRASSERASQPAGCWSGPRSRAAARSSYGYNERKDVEAAYELLRSLRIGVSGISMGAAAAAYAVGAGGIDPDWMILESCYDNIRHALENRLALQHGDALAHWLAWPIEVVVEQLVHLRARDNETQAARSL